MNLSATRDSGSKFYPRKTLDPKTSSNANLSNSKKIDADLTEEVNKWKQFGKMMAESYEDLNKKFINYNKEREKDKKVIAALKEQVFFNFSITEHLGEHLKATLENVSR